MNCCQLSCLGGVLLSAEGSRRAKACTEPRGLGSPRREEGAEGLKTVRGEGSVGWPWRGCRCWVVLVLGDVAGLMASTRRTRQPSSSLSSSSLSSSELLSVPPPKLRWSLCVLGLEAVPTAGLMARPGRCC